jgi:hypothetical protein
MSSHLEPAIPHKGGYNDLSRWKQFGGGLERPAPPAPIERRSEFQKSDYVAPDTDAA